MTDISRTLRLNKDLDEKLKKSAENNERSINAEIKHILKNSFEEQRTFKGHFF